MDIQYLIDILNKKEFKEAAEEVYHYMTSDLENVSLDLEKFISYIKASYIECFMRAEDDEEKLNIINSAIAGDIFIINIREIFQVASSENAKIGDIIDSNTLNTLTEYFKYVEDPLFKELSKYNKEIARAVNKHASYMSIGQIKRGDYEHAIGYRLSQKEIRTIENAKLVPTINRQIHLQYDKERMFRNFCEYDDIPDDDVLKRFAFHTNMNNPLFRIVFEDGAIIEYIIGDIRIQPYKYKDVVNYTKLCMISYMKHDGFNSLRQLNRGDILKYANDVQYLVHAKLSILNDVYTSNSLKNSKISLENIKKIVKQYSLQ